ncbi:MAG TPA: VCBS repeat-containing protein [Pyrinomonadaceae bacterium]
MTRSISARRLLTIISLSFLASSAFAQSMFEKINDFDGDGKADFAVTRSEGNQKIWYLWQTTEGFRVVHWGINHDNTVAGDYDGDGRTDLAIARLVQTFPVKLDYYILSSQTGSLIFNSVTSSGGPQWFQFPQDYDGDGKTDAGVLDGETRRITHRSSATGATTTLLYGSGDGAVRIGDMDGDVNCEVVSFTIATSTVAIRNPATSKTRVFHFGIFNDRFVPADFDGDGKGDLTIFRPSTGDWWWIRSSDNVVAVVHWGTNGDIAVPADYDGDGKTDQAVYRRNSPNGIYYVNGSQTGFQAFVWGLPDDLPVLY